MFIPQDSTTKKQLEQEVKNQLNNDSRKNVQVTGDFLSEFCDLDIWQSDFAKFQFFSKSEVFPLE